MLKNSLEKRNHEILRKAKVDFSYEGEPINYSIASNYWPDFIIWKSGVKIFIEIKGYLRPADKKKLEAVKRCNPDIDLRIVFEKDKKVYKKGKMLYSDWALKNGIPYAIGIIPKEWLK